MRRGLALLALLFVFFTISTVQADGSWSVDLVAGQHTTIGAVDFVISGDTLTATFNVTSPGWCLGVTHFYAGNLPPDRAAPGQFPYHHEGLDCVTSDSYSVPTPDGDVYVAAHAESDYDPDRANDEPVIIADTGTMTVNSGSSSYFDASVNIDGLASSYPAWCVDLEHLIFTGTQYDVDVFEAGDALVDNPDNLDLILYVINQDYSFLGATAYDVQVAIWLLIDDATPFGITPAALAIVDDARANGEGFTPGCGDLMGVFMDPGPDIQTIMAVVPAPCITDEGNARSETAWALADWGVEFGQGWGMYFQLVDAPDPEPPAPAPSDEPPAPLPTDEPPAPPADDNDGHNNGLGNNQNTGNAQGEPQRDNSNNSNSNNNGNNGGGNGNGSSNGNGNGNGN